MPSGTSTSYRIKASPIERSPTDGSSASETRRMFRLAFYEGRPILKTWCSLRALHQNRRRSWLNGKSERQRTEVRRASLPNPCEGRQRNELVPGRRQENG